MAASFFEQQAAARRATQVLVLLYLFAVAAVVLAVVTLTSAVYLQVRFDDFARAAQAARAAGGWLKLVPPGLLAAAALGTAGLILAVSLWSIVKLGGGGEKIAEMVGARPVSPNADDPLERRLLNVVEEMAIASGVRVPKVYVMDEETGINAFAAGYDVSNAVVSVTRGTLETLGRDELQGVIGHEFSHILNGDMRLNVRMLGVLEGIVFLSAIGAFVMRSVSHSRGRKDSASGGIFAVGLALFIIGYVGLFFARLIKAAVSRQREFLADASSVQFTRNPDGLAGALDQIGLAPEGARISNRYAEEMAHMYFGQAIGVWFGGLFDTHPPLEERIARVRPGFAPARYRAARPQPQEEVAPDRREAAVGVLTAAAALPLPDERRSGDRRAKWGRSAAESAALVGRLDAGKMDYAARLLAALPESLRARLREPEGARAAVIALLLAPKDDLMRAQLDALGAKGLGALAAAALEAAPLTRGLGPAFHLAIVDLALPALKLATSEARRELIVALEAVVRADRRVSVHELIVLTLVRAQLAPRARAAAPKYASLSAAREHAIVLLSLVARAGARATSPRELELEASAAFAVGAHEAGLTDASALAGGAQTLESVARSLEELRGLAPLAQALLIRGLFATATYDGSIRVVEAEFLRLAGAVLDCPLPPLLDKIDPATLIE